MSNVHYLPTVSPQGEATVSARVLNQFHPMQSDGVPQELGTLSLYALYEIVKRNLLLGFLLMSLGMLSAVYLTYFLTPQFKSKAILNIQSSYFQEPLAGDLISQEYDPSELRERRDALVQTAFDDPFLLSLIEKVPAVQEDLGYNFDLNTLGDKRSEAVLLHVLREKLEHYGLSASTFHISALASTPDLAFELNQQYVSQVLKRLSEERSHLLENSRTAIANHIRELSRELSAIERSLETSNEDVMLDQVTRLQADLEALLVQYTERHPKVSRLKQEVKSAQTKLEAFRKSAIRSRKKEAGVFSQIERSAAAKEPTQDVYNELLKKLSYLQIALSRESADSNQHIRVIQQASYPIDPTFPRKDLFAVFGLLLGFLMWLVGITIRETRAANPEEQDIQSLAKVAHIPYLGRLPHISESAVGQQQIRSGERDEHASFG